MSEMLLELDKVSYSYARGDWRLDGVSLGVERGDMIGIVGANGSGKSTLMKAAAGVLTIESGKVRLAGTDIRKISRRKLAQRLGFLPQQAASVFDFRVEQVVAMGRYCHSRGLGFTSAEDQRVIAEAMEATETTAFCGRGLMELSGGERQRVMLASVLAQQPDIMLLDEPAAGLDLHHQVTFFRLLADMSARGIGVVVITHDLNFAGQFCTKLLAMEGGRRVLFGQVEEVFERVTEMDVYSGDVATLRHPVNGKWAVLPYYKDGKTKGRQP